jgi:predicted phosphodiesterase
MSGVGILHLTDIHAGPGGFSDIDEKTKVPGAGVQTPLERLADYLKALAQVPDFVVVSGDVSNRGNQRGFDEFRKWLIDQSKTGVLPEYRRILIVPGNHDVARRTRPDEDDRKRFEPFWNSFGKTFPHSTIPGLDPTTLTPAIDPNASFVGGIETIQEAGEVKLTSHLPFMLDLNLDVLIYGFNSAHGCGIPLASDKNIVDPLRLVAGLSDENAKRALLKAENVYLDSLVVDAGMITPLQIAQFNGHMLKLKAQLGQKFGSITKIAVLHHHIGHLWEQQLELKVFEAVVDAAALKQALTEHSFDIVLHGHKHTNHVGIDGSLIPVDKKDRFSPLCVISGGTVGGVPRPSDHQSFKLIELEGKLGPRVAATVREIPLKPVNVPANVISHEARIFNVVLTDRFPHLHDIKTAKAAFDEDLVTRLAPELRAPGEFKIGTPTISSGSTLFSTKNEYKCYACIDRPDERVFYEVILATKAIKFGTLARIHWMVTELLAVANMNRPTKVIFLIGNVEDTHYSEADEPGETATSIDDLKSWLAPAIDAGLLEVRSHPYTQKDVPAIAGRRMT